MKKTKKRPRWIREMLRERLGDSQEAVIDQLLLSAWVDGRGFDERFWREVLQLRKLRPWKLQDA